LETDYSEQFAAAEVIGTADGYTFYSIPERDEQKISAFDEEYLAEYDKLQKELFDVEKSAKLFAPVDPAKAMVGQKLEFTTTDPDGNTVTSKELFADNEITVVNCWGLWCGNCMNEMTELKEFHDKIQEKGCGVVGLEYEYEWDDEVVKNSKDALSGFGITFPNVLIPEELVEQLLGFPTTFFVDKEGTVLCMPVTGAYVDKYERALESLLQGEAAADVPVEDAANVIAENQDVLYNVCVTDENGPVAGVIIQFCSSTSCQMGKTDAEGVTGFTMPAGEIYDIHVLKAPEGYEKDNTVYHTENGKSDVQIQLKKK
jgi:thiol-disulfide isomerase/thioredoxin